MFADNETGQKNLPLTKADSATAASCRAEIEKIIDTAMALGDYRGIALITDAANNYNTCLSPHDSSIGNLYHKAGVLYYINNSYNDAIDWFNKALQLREKNQGKYLEPLINTLNGLTQSHLQLFHYDTAEQLIERQLSLIEKTEHTYDETKADLYLADAQLAFVIEDYTRCLEKLTIASNQYESVNTNAFNHGVALNMLGATTDLLNQPAKAITYYHRAIQIFNLNKETYFKALSFHNMGMAYAKLNSLDSAVIYLNLSFEIHNANSDTIELGRHYIEVAKVASAENQFEKAKHFAQISLKFRKQKLPAWHSDVIESQLALGNIYVQEAKQNANQQKEMNNLAMALFDDALIAALKSPRSERALEPLSNKAILCSYQGKQDLQLAENAHNLFQQADSIIQLSRLQYRHQESKIEFTRKIRNTYEHAIKNALWLYQFTQNKKYFEDALVFCEKSKATAIRDKLHKQAVQVNAGIPDSLLKQERQLSLQLGAATQTLLSISDKSDPTYNETLKTLESVKHRMEEFDDRLEKDFPRYFYWLTVPEQKASIDDIQQVLKPGSILVEYFLGSQQIFVFGVSKKQYQNWIIASNDSTLTAITNFIQHVEGGANFSTTATFENAYSVYQLLLEQPLNYFAAIDDVSNLKIVPDGIIGSIPFDALMTNANESNSLDVPYLIKKYSHSFLFSNRLLLEKAPLKQWFGNKTCAIFGIAIRVTNNYMATPFIQVYHLLKKKY
nr:tetratricopeptide repeat protein [Bacteroidota bacterium]